MTDQNQALLEAVFEAWDRSNEVMLNLLRALPTGGLQAKAAESSATVAQQFMHLHHERLCSIQEEAPECGATITESEWKDEQDADQIAKCLSESAAKVKSAMQGRLLAGKLLDENFGHPVLMIQFLLWHDAYHHGQIKLALKLSGTPLSDNDAGPLTWGVWRRRLG